MHVWVTKYALSSGIFEADVEPPSYECPTMVSHRQPGCMMACYHKGEWHATYEDAATRAQEMRLKKIASLRKQITKLEGLVF